MSVNSVRRVIKEQTPDNKKCPINTYFHMAVILGKGGKIIAKATNRVGSRSSGCGYSDYTIHAERAVVKKLGDMSLLKGATLCVWRISTANIMPSKPCTDCEIFLTKCMKKYGLLSVKYTDTVLPF